VLTPGVVGTTVNYSEVDLHRVHSDIERDVGRVLAAGSDDFSARLMVRARQQVPIGPSAREAYSIKTHRKVTVRERGRDGLSHPGALQRSGKRTVAQVGPLISEHTLFFETPYAAYQHGGKSRQSGYSRNLQYTKGRPRGANFLYDMGHRGDFPSPLSVMLKSGDFESVIAPPGKIA
jgi:hypothetical protein